MDTTGYVYVPGDCRDGKRECRLHIVFHGCEQGRYLCELVIHCIASFT